MHPMLRTKTFRIALIVAVVIALYAVAGFVVAPKLMRSALLKDIPAAINATPSVGEIHINPFLFQATIDDFALAGADGEQLLGFRRLFVDFQLSSIWHRAYTFANIDITAPAVSAVMAKDGRLNLLALKPKPSPTPPPADKEEPLPALRIGSFKVSQGSVAYEDRSRPDVFAARLEPLNFELRDFKTGVDGGRFTFTAASKLGERVEWHGHVSVDPLESDGEFRVDGLLAHTLWEYLQDQVNFVVDSGSVDLAATYKVSLKDPSAPSLQVDLSKVSLTDLTVAPRPADAEASPGESNSKEEPWITIPSLAVTGGKVDLASHQAHVDLVSLNGMKLKTWLQSDKTLNLMKFAAPRTNATPTTPGPASTIPGAAPAAPTATLTASPGAAAAAAMPWTFDLRQFDIHDASIATEDRSAHPGVKVLLAPFSLQVSGASQDLTKPVTVALDTRINERGSLTVGGQVTPRPVMANLDVKFADIDLTTIQPYIAQQTAMTLLSGKLGGAGKVHYGVQPKMPAIQFAGNITVEKLHTVDDALHDDFINWDRLDIEGIDYTQAPDRLDIDQIVARKLYARVIIETDTRINVKRVLKIPATAGPTGRAKRVTTAAVVDSPGTGTGTGTGTGIRAGAAPGSRAAAKHTRKDKVVAAAPASQTMPMSIKKVVIQASEANFADFSVKPNFATGIQNLHGSVVGLSSKPGTRAKVDLTGAVDTFSPVSITGEVNVLGPLYTDLTMSFRNISLPVFDPYSGKFTGYNIAKGKLTTELHYKVDGRKLDAEHHIIIEQLEFGDKTASKDAVSLPIKLAVSLLKDRNGVIDLNLPVTGSLDDPQFRLAPVIWKVLVNILERAVAAPFALLGSVFGGGPDLQFVDFQPGVASLDAAALDKAKIIAKALSERPQLKIDVPIAVVPEIDRPALVDAAYRAQIAAERATKASSKKGAATAGGAGPAFDQLDPATQLDLLTSLYAKDVGSEPKYPDDVTGVKSKPDRVAAKIGFLSKGIRQHVVVGDAELQTLGQQRALAFQQALLTDSPVEAERVFLVANDKATANDGLVRLELSLK
jgi:hypothetical protein